MSTLPTRSEYLRSIRETIDTLPRVYDAIGATDADNTYLPTHAERAAFYPHTLPEHARTYDTIDAARRDVEASGSHYFSRDAVRFFRGRTHKATTPSGLYGRRFWVESVQHVWTDYREGVTHTEPRRYRIVWVEAPSTTSEILSIARLGDYATLREARAAARKLAAAVDAIDAAHVDYPHHAGHLYDCMVCEGRCWCVTEADAPCVWGADDDTRAHHGTREARDAWNRDHGRIDTSGADA